MNIVANWKNVEFIGTPEAGKTTTINTLHRNLNTKYGICATPRKESAEFLPNSIPKTTREANFWIRTHNMISLLESKFQHKESRLLIERGLIDNLFWNLFKYKEGEITCQEKTVFDNYAKILLDVPDFVVALYTTPETAILRRGREGQLVTFKYVQRFNEVLEEFVQEIKKEYSNIYFLDTTELSKDEVVEHIENLLVSFK